MKILVLFVLLAFGVLQKDVIFDEITDTVKYNLSENSSYPFVLEFCPSNNCKDRFVSLIEGANFEVKCALHELDNVDLGNTFKEVADSGVTVKIVVDGSYLGEAGTLVVLNSSAEVRSDGKRSKLMHDKFCVVDDKYVLTGSTNPTNNGFYVNNNNMILFESKLIAQNYENEFDDLFLGVFGPKKRQNLDYNLVRLNAGGEEYVISTYFCPINDCANRTIDILNLAKSEILFANFVITDDGISDTLIKKSEGGVYVMGVVERQMFNIKGSDVSRMSEVFDLRSDTNSGKMHHKFFIIDRKYVVTGSMNPSSSGTKYNDENLIIIENENLAKRFVDEFHKLYVVG